MNYKVGKKGYLEPSYQFILLHCLPTKDLSDLGRRTFNLRGLTRSDLDIVTFPLLDGLKASIIVLRFCLIVLLLSSNVFGAVTGNFLCLWLEVPPEYETALDN